MKLEIDSYSGFKQNVSRLRAEAKALMHVRNRGGASSSKPVVEVASHREREALLLLAPGVT